MSSELPVGGILIVRATVREDLVDAFDRWYEEEHLPEALDVFGAHTARRGWTSDDDGTHCAIYEFESIEQMTAKLGSDEMSALLARFDAAWPEGVARKRDFVQVAQAIQD